MSLTSNCKNIEDLLNWEPRTPMEKEEMRETISSNIDWNGVFLNKKKNG
jgi:hypothetical protein